MSNLRLELTPSQFRQRVRTDPDAPFQPAAKRYHLYVMYGCPWAHRTLIVRALKGLEHAIDITAVHHRLIQSEGWTFDPDRPEPLYGAPGLRTLYLMANPTYRGRITVPVLWDKQERTIVNNESTDIMRMLNSAFDAFAERPSLDLYPKRLRRQIDRWNARIQSTVNVGAYAVGFAETPAGYDVALREFFTALDEIEVHLATNRFLAGEQPTEADWRLFPTLVRFAWVYHDLFKCNLKQLTDYPHLLGYARELYQWPGIAATVNEQHIRQGYYESMLDLNPSGVVPPAPRIDFSAPHRRGRTHAAHLNAEVSR